jgi:hypothetical protein
MNVHEVGRSLVDVFLVTIISPVALPALSVFSL